MTSEKKQRLDEIKSAVIALFMSIAILTTLAWIAQTVGFFIGME